MKKKFAILLLAVAVLSQNITAMAYPIQISETQYAEINYGAVYEDTFGDYYNEAMINCLNHQPKGVLQYLDEQNWNIYLSDENIDHYFNNEKSYLGATHFYEKWIKITTNSFGFHYMKSDTEKERAYKTVLTHEIGHALDAKYGGDNRFSETAEFKNVFNQDAIVFAEHFGAGSYDNVEYFAEAYKIYLLYSEAFQKKCPSTYNYIQALLMNEFPYVEDSVEN